MGYTRKQILEKCEIEFENKKTFYQAGFVNYRGKTTDTGEYYTEVVAEFLCKNINEYISGISRISRKYSYKTESHDGEVPRSNRKEEITAIEMYNQRHFDCIGEIIDYQTPLKSSKNDQAVGKIDLLSFDGKTMRILELKKEDSVETMLRCVLEGFTYLKTVDTQKLVKDFDYDAEKVVVKASPFVFFGKEQHKEIVQLRPYLKQLMQLLDSKPYYIKKYNEKYFVEE